MKQDNIPILYVYIFKNIKDNCFRISNSDQVMFAVKNVIRRAPKIVVRQILTEMEQMQLLKRCDDRCRRYELLNNSLYDRKLKLLKDYIFPLNPNGS